MGLTRKNDYFEAEAVIGIRRHRILTDGKGITTLVGFHKCPLSCKYCINPHCNQEDGMSRWVTPNSLFQELLKDDIYFRTTGGGITFGGGEPLLQYEFIKKFHSIVDANVFISDRVFIRDKWKIAIETSLNVPLGNLKVIADIVDEYIIDIKDMNPDIYKRYTKMDNKNVVENLKWLIEHGRTDSLFIRVPLIPGYNTEEDVNKSVYFLENMGVQNIERFQYIVPQEMASKSKYKSSMGKTICSTLKQIRIDVAQKNGILYEPSICHYEGDCSGTCPKCEQELKELSNNLFRINKI